jgi:hypothetical protein
MKEHNGTIRIPIIAADKRVIEKSFGIKASFIDLSDRKSVCCVMFHSWWLNNSNLNSAVKTLFKYGFADLKDVLEGS